MITIHFSNCRFNYLLECRAFAYIINSDNELLPTWIERRLQQMIRQRTRILVYSKLFLIFV